MSSFPFLRSAMRGLACGTLLLFSGCSDLFEAHVYDANLSDEEHRHNARAIERIERLTVGAPTLRFVFLSDTQRWYDETRAAVHSINARSDIDFVLHGGDISDFGATREFVWQKHILDDLHVPYVVLMGNHDYLGSGLDTYRTLFGELDFAFTAGVYRFVCLNTSALEVDYSIPVPNFSFLADEIARNEAPETSATPTTSTVVAMHVRPMTDQFNNNVNSAFEYYVRRLRNPLFCLSGHLHRMEVNDLFDDGLLYYGVTCMADRTYMIFTLSPDLPGGYSYEVVTF